MDMHQLRSRYVPATVVDSVCIRTCKNYSERRGGRQLLVGNQVRNSRGPRCPVLNRRLYRICRTAMSNSGRITSRCGDGYSVTPPKMERRLRSRLKPTNDSCRVGETYIRTQYAFRAWKAGQHDEIT